MSQFVWIFWKLAWADKNNRKKYIFCMGENTYKVWRHLGWGWYFHKKTINHHGEYWKAVLENEGQYESL